MIQIERLRMNLPAGFDHRAVSISRLVGQVMAAKRISSEMELERISLPTVKVRLHSSDREIANLIVEEILAAIDGRKG